MAVAFDTYKPFDNGAGKDVREAGWRDMFSDVFPSGPIISNMAPANWGTQLQPYASGSGMQVFVRPGRVWVRGHHGVVLLDKALPVASNSTGSNRYDAVVARGDFINDIIELDIVTGTSNTAGPALVTDSTKWEVLLGIVTVPNAATSIISANVSDRRKLMGYSEGTYAGTFVHASGTIAASYARYVRVNGVVHVWIGVPLASITYSSARLTLPYPHGHATGSLESLGLARIQAQLTTGNYTNYYVNIEADATTTQVHFGSHLQPATSENATETLSFGSSIRANFSYVPAQ